MLEQKISNRSKESFKKLKDKSQEQLIIKEQNNPSKQIHFFQQIILSNQQLIKSQSFQIKCLREELIHKEKFIQLLKQQDYRNTTINKLQKKVEQLQTELVKVKMQLAQKWSEGLQKDFIIKNLNSEKLIDDDSLEIKSSVSEIQINTISSDQACNYSQSNLIIDQNNIDQFIQPAIQNKKSNIQSIIQCLFNKTIVEDLETQSLTKQWQKIINQYIQSQSIKSSFLKNSSLKINSQFLNSSYQLLKKNFSIPHSFRKKVWKHISVDNLGITHPFFIQLVTRRKNGHVSQKVSNQIKKDIIRSFNGEGSKDKLKRIFQTARGIDKRNYLSKQKEKQSFKEAQFMRKSSLETVDSVIQAHESQNFQTKNEVLLQSNFQFQGKSNSYILEGFQIAQQVIQILELFSLYRPDIGFVQGMTYPTIILSLILQKQQSFSLLCNLLLCNSFFRSMISFEPHFINFSCRVFDQILKRQNKIVYNYFFKQLQIKSEVFLIDWFFTFFSRNICPMTILKIWDLLLFYQGLKKAPQLVFYKISLVILELLEPILLKVNYEEAIRTVRDYANKIDQSQLIKRLYEGLTKESQNKRFQQSYQKAKGQIIIEWRKNLKKGYFSLQV